MQISEHNIKSIVSKKIRKNLNAYTRRIEITYDDWEGKEQTFELILFGKNKDTLKIKSSRKTHL